MSCFHISYGPFGLPVGPSHSSCYGAGVGIGAHNVTSCGLYLCRPMSNMFFGRFIATLVFQLVGFIERRNQPRYLGYVSLHNVSNNACFFSCISPCLDAAAGCTPAPLGTAGTLSGSKGSPTATRCAYCSTQKATRLSCPARATTQPGS